MSIIIPQNGVDTRVDRIVRINSNGTEETIRRGTIGNRDFHINDVVENTQIHIRFRDNQVLNNNRVYGFDPVFQIGDITTLANIRANQFNIVGLRYSSSGGNAGRLRTWVRDRTVSLITDGSTIAPPIDFSINISSGNNSATIVYNSTTSFSQYTEENIFYYDLNNSFTASLVPIFGGTFVNITTMATIRIKDVFN